MTYIPLLLYIYDIFYDIFFGNLIWKETSHCKFQFEDLIKLFWSEKNYDIDLNHLREVT